MSYELDILYIILSPFSIIVNKTPISYYFGHADYFLWSEVLFNLNALLPFSLFCILSIYFHIQSGTFHIKELTIRLVLSLCSLFLYICFFSYFY